MSRKDAEARGKIIAAATELIKKYGDMSCITIRDIAAGAEVGVGLVNYHFQTKENLLAICVRNMVRQDIGGFEALYRGLEGKPLDKLKYLVKGTGRYFDANPGVSRVSILSDFQGGTEDDNSTQSFKAFLPVVRSVCGDQKSEEQVRLLTLVVLSFMQVSFLRKDVLQDLVGIDFAEPSQRSKAIDFILDALFHEE